MAMKKYIFRGEKIYIPRRRVRVYSMSTVKSTKWRCAMCHKDIELWINEAYLSKDKKEKIYFCDTCYDKNF